MVPYRRMLNRDELEHIAFSYFKTMRCSSGHFDPGPGHSIESPVATQDDSVSVYHDEKRIGGPVGVLWIGTMSCDNQGDLSFVPHSTIDLIVDLEISEDAMAPAPQGGLADPFRHIIDVVEIAVHVAVRIVAIEFTWNIDTSLYLVWRIHRDDISAFLRESLESQNVAPRLPEVEKARARGPGRRPGPSPVNNGKCCRLRSPLPHGP